VLRIVPASANSIPGHGAFSNQRSVAEQRRSSRPLLILPRAAAILIFLAVVLPAWAQRPSARTRERANSENRKSTRVPRLDISKINDPNTRDTVGPHSEGDAVVRAEVLLDRIKFSPGEIGTTYDDNFAKSVAAFQAASGLPAMGSVDLATWAALNDDQAAGHVQQRQSQPQPNQSSHGAQPQQSSQPNGQVNPQNQNQTAPPPAVISYTILPEDVAGPFTTIPEVGGGRDRGERMLLREARFRQLNYASPLQLLAEKFHSTPRLLVELNPAKTFKEEGEQIQVPNVLTPALQQASSVVVDASTHSVTALDGSGKILAFYPATVGSQHDPLPVGNWTVKEIKRYPKFKYNPNLFWDSEDKRPRATLPPGPRNPVGVVWIGLSKEHYGIHGTPQPSLIGQTQSHGCIRLTNWDASELAGMVKVGTPILLEEGAASPAQPQPVSSR
jgi:lipoprotein-anchoring transpeptidase ErfK/SrfK